MRRVLGGALVAAAVGGLAAGLLVGKGGTARAAGPPGIVARGQFHSLGWGTNGTAKVVRTRSGTLVVRFGPDFRTQKAPALWVFVGRYSSLHASQTAWQRIGFLHKWFGAQTYHLDRAPVAGDSVIIFCGKCNRAFGAATLRVRS